MFSRALTPQEVALLDTGTLRRPAEAIERWFNSQERWAVAMFRDPNTCSGLLLATKDGDTVVCGALTIATDEPEDTITYRLVDSLCQQIDGLTPNHLEARLTQANKGVVEALNIMGVTIASPRSVPTTSGPGHYAA